MRYLHQEECHRQLIRTSFEEVKIGKILRSLLSHSPHTPADLAEQITAVKRGSSDELIRYLLDEGELKMSGRNATYYKISSLHLPLEKNVLLLRGTTLISMPLLFLFNFNSLIFNHLWDFLNLFSPVSPTLRRVKNRKTIRKTSRYSNMTACVHNAWAVRTTPSNALPRRLPFEEDFETMGYLANFTSQMGETEKAHELLEKMTEIEPEHMTTTFLTLANVCYMQEDYPQWKRRQAKQSTSKKEMHRTLTCSEKPQWTGDEIMTIAHLTKAITLKDDFIEARLLRAEALLQMKQYKETMEDIDTILAQDPEDESAILLRGKIEEATGDRKKKQKQTIKYVTEMNPFNEQAFSILGQLYINQKKLAEAIDLFDGSHQN